MFEPLGIGPLPGPGTRRGVRRRAGRPRGRRPARRAVPHRRRRRTAPTSSSSRSTPTTPGRGIGRALLRAGCDWAAAAGYDELTLATYRDVPWNGPFYASEGFVEVGPVDDWLAAHGLPPEEPVMGRFGARVVMRRRL